MSLTTRVKTLLLVLALAFFANVVNAAAIPSDVDLVSPDGYKLLPQTFKEISDPSDTTGKVFRVYDLPQSVNVPEKIKRELQKRDNWCNNSEFVNKSSPASPLVNDCLAIVRRMRQLKQTWVVGRNGNNGGFQRIYAYGTCEFGAKGMFMNVKMGNDDVADLIGDSIRRFQWFDKVGAEGTLSCVVYNGQAISPARWAIFHT